jgi:ribA/ribD-fused uncharacterized protein
MQKNITTDTHVFFLTSEFSQWYPSDFCDEKNNQFNCAEQWMMFKKAELFGDKNVMAKVLACKDPSAMKSLGRQVQGFNQTIWDEACQNIVARGNVLKFSQNRDLWDVLDGTEERMLVEAASYDPIWGIGLGAEAAVNSNPSTWGSNFLGKSAMKTRDFLRAHPELVATPALEDRKNFQFYDRISQRAIRFSRKELSAALGVDSQDLGAALERLGQGLVEMDRPPFLKAPVKQPASALLSSLRSAMEPPAKKSSPKL